MTNEKEPTIFFSMDSLLNHYEIGFRTFYKLIDAGAPARKIGNRWAIHRESFEKFLKKYLAASSV